MLKRQTSIQTQIHIQIQIQRQSPNSNPNSDPHWDSDSDPYWDSDSGPYSVIRARFRCRSTSTPIQTQSRISVEVQIVCLIYCLRGKSRSCHLDKVAQMGCFFSEFWCIGNLRLFTLVCVESVAQLFSTWGCPKGCLFQISGVVLVVWIGNVFCYTAGCNHEIIKSTSI
jgi:hypothetical protein